MSWVRAQREQHVICVATECQRSKGTGKEMHELIHQPSSNSYDNAKINFHQIYLKDIMIDNMAALGEYYKHLALFI